MTTFVSKQFPDQQARDFFTSLQEQIARHPALEHPFLVRFAEGGLTREQLGMYAVQHYLYSRFFTRNLASVVSNTPDEHARSLLILNMYEEIGEPFKVRERAHLALLEKGLVSQEDVSAACVVALQGQQGADPVKVLLSQGKVTREQLSSAMESCMEQARDLTHPALFRRFLRALGLTPERIEATEPLPETLQLIAEYQQVCRQGHWLEALGAMGPGTECVVATLYTFLKDGIEKSGHLRPEEYIFWTVHIHCDDGHGKNIIDALLPYAASAENQRRIAAGAMGVLNARAAWFSGLNRLVFGASRHVASTAPRPPSRPPRITEYLPQ